MQEAGDPQQPRRAPNGSTVLTGTLAGLPPTADDTVILPIQHWVTACCSGPGSVPGLGDPEGMRHRPCSHKSHRSMTRGKAKG